MFWCSNTVVLRICWVFHKFSTVVPRFSTTCPYVQHHLDSTGLAPPFHEFSTTSHLLDQTRLKRWRYMLPRILGNYSSSTLVLGPLAGSFGSCQHQKINLLWCGQQQWRTCQPNIKVFPGISAQNSTVLSTPRFIPLPRLTKVVLNLGLVVLIPRNIHTGWIIRQWFCCYIEISHGQPFIPVFTYHTVLDIKKKEGNSQGVSFWSNPRFFQNI